MAAIISKNWVEKLAIGTAQFGLDYGISNTQGQVPEERVQKILSFAEEKGIQYLDTALAYGNSEEVLGRQLNTKSFFRIVSKLSTINGMTVRKTFNQSLDNLKQESIYGYLIHNYADYEQNPDIWEQMIGIKNDKKVRKVGFSLYYPHELERLLEQQVKFELLQLPYNLLDRRFEPYFKSLKKLGVEIHVRSVFLQGLYFLSEDALSDHFNPIKPLLKRLNHLMDSSDKLALLLQFALKNEFVDQVVVGITSLEEFAVNLFATEKAIDYDSEDIDIPELNEQILIPSNWPTI